jgi:membrane-associated phospholipid phosphatase
MTQREAVISWRLFVLNWIPLGILAITLAASLAFTDFSLGLGGVVFSGGFVACYAGVAYYNAKAPHRRDPQVVFTLGAIAQIVLTTMLATPLSYVAASFAFPMQDANLLAIDRMLGFDGRAYLSFVNDHPTLAMWLQAGYGMIAWPVFAIPIILSAARRYARMQEFILAFALALSVTILISVFLPALGIFSLGAGPETYPNIPPVAYLDLARDVPLVRDGSLRHLELLGLSGLVAFPSFHTASAILYLWALWPVRWIRPVAIVANVVMLAATPVDGAHYLVDILGGAVVGVLAIMAARYVSRRVASRIPSEQIPALQAASDSLAIPASVGAAA